MLQTQICEFVELCKPISENKYVVRDEGIIAIRRVGISYLFCLYAVI